MYFAIVIHFCILCTFANGAYGNSHELPMGVIRPDADMILKGPSGQLDQKQYMAEVAAGDHSMFMGSNPHHNNPRYFTDLGRRFVPVYPYKKKVKQPKNKKDDLDELLQYIRDIQSHKRSDDENEDQGPIPIEKNVKQRKKDDFDELLQYIGDIQSNKRNYDEEDQGPLPIKAPPEVVLAVMKQAKKTFKPREPTDDALSQNMLRSGDYWNDVYEEKVDPENILRSRKPRKHHKKESGTEPIAANLVPGTKLYKLIGDIVKRSPRLVYIINDK